MLNMSAKRTKMKLFTYIRVIYIIICAIHCVYLHTKSVTVLQLSSFRQAPSTFCDTQFFLCSLVVNKDFIYYMCFSSGVVTGTCTCMYGMQLFTSLKYIPEK